MYRLVSPKENLSVNITLAQLEVESMIHCQTNHTLAKRQLVLNTVRI